MTIKLYDVLKLKVQLADKVLKGTGEETNWEEIKFKEILLLEEIVKRQNAKQLLDQEAEKLPKKIPFGQAHGGRKLKKLNYEKKRFLDCIKAARGLCEDLNRMDPVTLDRFRLPIWFEVS